MNTANNLVNLIVMALLGGFVGYVMALISTKFMTKTWRLQESKDFVVELGSFCCILLGLAAGGYAGSIGLAYGLLFLLGEVVFIPIAFLALWCIARAAFYAVRWADKAAHKLTDLGVKYLERRFAG